MKLGRLNHIGVATTSIADSLAHYREVMGAVDVTEPFDLPEQGMRSAFSMRVPLDAPLPVHYKDIVRSPEMHSERVTYLSTADQKAALEAFAAARGESVGSVLREAAARYMAEPLAVSREEEAALELLAEELEAAIPRWNAKFDSMEASLDRAHEAVRKALAEVEATK